MAGRPSTYNPEFCERAEGPAEQSASDEKSYLAFVTSAQYRQDCRARKSSLTRKDRELRKRFKITEADYQFMLSAQGGRCGICKTPQGDMTRSLAVDHCHETGRIRGLLCGNCNTAIGLLKDSREAMVRAARWVMTDAELGIGDAQAN